MAEHLFADYQDYWRFQTTQGMQEPRTFVIVAWPSLPAKVRFVLDEGPLEAVVPPTYISSAERSRCLDVLGAVFRPRGYAVDWARVPVKLLAAHSGLVRYGRNNIAYVPGLGSYVRLGALCTDADLCVHGLREASGACAETVERESTRVFMDACERCRACSNACPTGCIPQEGTVIDAAHCITQANENEGGWPDWVPARSHNSLVGCMCCQEACPLNRAHLGREVEVVAEFDRDETDSILGGLSAEQLPEALLSKLVTLDLEDYLPVLGRNLMALRDAARN